ncbi:MAG: helix-turn-helix transcriptional regulator [Candidatus Omnitrophica bacterium]|nr:helix-turn-helix transcriptional regulator [Candidatus Omnitrophota bacterium]MDE2008693.1 helix-turn-helix transcriptional regulator [Candidatus Omnitrophota bacterium]MDE2214834.1 helix-turn-helix transcriptional regulator [Candidatus Omnitrophota bacterium]MDE2231954.1 helix-turn-helix transcriptional regulator [Candidatus Omnitrophota bacterium]
MDYEKSAAFLKALGHPVRLKMAQGLITQYGCHVSKMVEKLGLPQSTISQHLAALRQAGVVTFEKKGVKACYHLTDERIVSIIKILGEIL